MRQHLLVPRLQVVVGLLQDAVAAGELPSTIDPESAVYGLAGSSFARLALVGRGHGGWAREVVAGFRTGDRPWVRPAGDAPRSCPWSAPVS